MTPEAKQLLKDKPEAVKEIFMTAFNEWNDSEVYGIDDFEKAFNDLLKEHTQPDWEILSFKCEGQLIKLRENGKYITDRAKNNDLPLEATLDSMLNADYISVKSGHLSIHSVRRSDGEVFTVGDKVGIKGSNTISRIKEIKLKKNDPQYPNEERPYFSGEELSFGMYIQHLTKLKPLFTTEDGKPVYEGDETIPVCKDNYAILSSNKWDGTDTSLIYFSTREAAEKWVEENKPSVSISQLREAGISEDTIIKLRHL